MSCGLPRAAAVTRCHEPAGVSWPHVGTYPLAAGCTPCCRHAGACSVDTWAPHCLGPSCGAGPDRGRPLIRGSQGPPRRRATRASASSSTLHPILFASSFRANLSEVGWTGTAAAAAAPLLPPPTAATGAAAAAGLPWQEGNFSSSPSPSPCLPLPLSVHLCAGCEALLADAVRLAGWLAD